MQISYDEGNVVLTEVRDFDLAQTLECGQCFHFKKLAEQEYAVCAFHRLLRIRQEKDSVILFDTAMQEIDFVENPYAVFLKLTEIINSDMDFYGALLRSSRNAGLTHKIRLTLQQKAQERFESRIDLPPERISVMMDYAVSGMVAVYQSWFNSERRQSIEEISDIASRMCLTGLRGAAADARLKE